MARVLDLTTDDADAVLERTDASGLLSSGHLLEAPLSTHLADGEVARYLVENKKEGLAVVAGDDERQYAPDGDYRAFALVTDRRVLFVAGRASGDETVSLPLADVLEADSERAGVISSALVLATHDGRRFRFPCRGELDAVLEAINDDAAAWSHAVRLLENADAAVERASGHLDAGAYDEALAAMADASNDWEEALATLEPVHPAAVEGLHERVAVRRGMAASLRRRIRAAAGASAHANAQAAWRNRRYERAAAAYDDAAAAYTAARKRPGDEPTDGQLTERLRAVARERALLRAVPVADAETEARRARQTDAPASAAETWEEALDRYRAALELAWGTGGRRFAVDREETRQAAAAAADGAIDARIEASQQWLAAGDELAGTEGEAAAARAWQRARSHLDRGADIAREVRPDREADVADWRPAIEDRLAGEVDPDAAANDAPLPADTIADTLSVLEETGDDATETPVTPADGPAQVPAGADAGPPGTPDTSPPDVAGGVGGDDADESSEATSSADVAEAIDAAQGAWDGAGETWESPAATDGAAAEDAEPPPAGLADVEEAVAGARDVDVAALSDALSDLARTDLAELVAEVWRARGWRTVVFAAGGDAVYDVLGVSPAGDARLLVWLCHRPDGGSLDGAVLDRIAATRARAAETASTVVVTTGSVPSAVRDRAAAADVAVVDREAFCELLVAADLVGAVLDEGS